MKRIAAIAAVMGLVACGGGDDANEPEPAETQQAAITWKVNGHTLAAEEQAALTVLAKDVVPRLTGTRARRVGVTSRAAWWALKEGTWVRTLPRAYRYSNCNSSTGDHLLGPTERCGTGRAWQVGIAAVQVPGHGVDELEKLAGVLYPGKSTSSLLADLTTRAQLAESDARAVVDSVGSLRASWLLRVPAIGVHVVESAEVVPECIEGSMRWCYGTGWDETRWYAPNKTAALRAIEDIRAIVDALAP